MGYILRLNKIGNSIGLIIPSYVVKEMGLKKETHISINKVIDNENLNISSISEPIKEIVCPLCKVTNYLTEKELREDVIECISCDFILNNERR